MRNLAKKITFGISESEIADLSNKYMEKEGATSFWYHGVGTLVLVGERTRLSISGKDYVPSKIKVRKNDLVTIDLGPAIKTYWGDFARSFAIENGGVVENPKEGTILRGIEAEIQLHSYLISVIKPEMTFSDMYKLVDEQIKQKGFVNLDFKGNLGHTIEKEIDKRRYIEEDCKAKFSECKLFTFEPHIKKTNGQLGFKREDIYYCSEGKIHKL